MKEIRTLEAFVRFAYARSGRFIIPPAVRDELSREDSVVADLKGEVEAIAADDPLFKVPFRMLAAVDRARANLRLRRRVLSVAAMVFLSSPALRVAGLDRALLDAESGDPEELLALAAVALDEDGSDPDLKKADLRVRRTNALVGLALYFALQREWDESRLAQVLDAAVWQGEYRNLRGSKRESPKALLAETSGAALGAAANAWQTQLQLERERSQSADRLRASAESDRADAETALVDARQGAERLARELADREQEVGRLTGEVAAALDSLRVQSSHAVDDFESLRTRVIRSFDRQTALLEDALHALRNGSSAVTEEYLERVIEALTGEVDRLRDVDK